MQLEKFKEQVKSSVKESMSPHNQMQNINAYDQAGKKVRFDFGAASNTYFYHSNNNTNNAPLGNNENSLNGEQVV